MDGLIFGGAYLIKINWASLIVGSKFTDFALFYFVFEGNFPSSSPRDAYIWRGDLTAGFLSYRFGGLRHGGAYFRNFTLHRVDIAYDISLNVEYLHTFGIRLPNIRGIY